MKAPRIPVFGYFQFKTAQDVVKYAKILAESQSIIVFAHMANTFYDKNKVEHVVHSKSPGSQLFDKEMDEEILEKYLLKVSSDEILHNMEGSGFSVKPGTIQWWVKFAPCQPNPQINFDKVQTPTEKRYDEIESTRKANSLATAIVRCIAHLENHKLGSDLSVVNWFKRNLDWDTSHFIKDINDFHKKHFPDYRIRVFTYFGNVIYNFSNLPNPLKIINLGWSATGRRFYAITDLQKIMNRKGARYFCDECNKFHKNSKHCSSQPTIKLPKEETRTLFEKPEGKVKYVVYADFEAAVDEESGNHTISGYAFVMINAKGDIIHKGITSGENIVEDFMNKMADLAKRYLEVQIFFHNFRGYDSHFLMKELVTKYNPTYFNGKSLEKMNHIRLEIEHDPDDPRYDPNYPKEIDKYGKEKKIPEPVLHLKDTFNFLSSSLASLCNTVDEWKYAESKEKGIFPYDWFTDISKLEYEGLPDGPWYNKLTHSYQDYEQAHKRFKELGFIKFKEYHDYYMMLDTLQLADIFENFRNATIQRFNIDPCHFQGAPSLTWYLAMHKLPIYMIQDEQVYLDISTQIRGGVSQAMLRYMKSDKDSDIIFLDINSLYSKCMTYPLPTKFIGTTYTYDTDHPDNECYFVCVDLEYPDNLHDRDWQYPLCPHRYNNRLCTTLLPKKNILLHEETFKFYLSRGMKCTAMHYAYKFQQAPILKDYVENNIIERRKTKSEALKSLYKLLNNSLYGKTCENVLNYRRFSALKRDPKIHGTVNSLLADCHVKDFMIFDEDSYLIESEVATYILDKPVQMGFAILEFAKLEMYKFIAALQDQYGEDINFMYTDTDSLMIQTMFPNAYEVLYANPAINPFLDFSCFGKNPERAKQSGLWAPETTDKILKYVGLRAKSYAYVTENNGKEISHIKNKGIPKNATKTDDTEITFEDFRQVLKQTKEIQTHFHKISSKKHKVQTEIIEKLGLSPHDEKRMLVSDVNISLPFGYRGEIFSDLYYFQI